MESNPIYDLEHLQLVGGERQESWSSYGGSDCKKQSSDFFLQPISNSPSLHVHEWEDQCKVSYGEEVQALSQFDRTNSLVEDLYWKAQFEERQRGVKDEVALPNLQLIKDCLEALKSTYIHLIEDRDYAL